MRFIAFCFLALSMVSCKEESSEINSFSGELIAKTIVNDSIIPDEKTSEKKIEHIKPVSEDKKKNAIINSPETWKQFYKQNHQPAQTFSIKADKEQVIDGKSGTRIKIPANAFIIEHSGLPVSGDVKVSLSEYYSVSDMILANLSTLSDNRILETGGMLYIEATSQGEKVKLITGKSIEISFPVKESKKDMQLFSGKRDENEQMNWIVENQFREVSIVRERENGFGGGNYIASSYRTGFKIPEKALNEGLSGTIIINTTVNKKGDILAVSVAKGIEPEVDQDIADQLMKMGSINGPNITRTIMGDSEHTVIPIPVKISVNNGSKIVNSKTVNESNYSEANTQNLMSYVFNSSKLGWINCDRFIPFDVEKNNYYVSTGDADSRVCVVFHRFRSIIPAMTNDVGEHMVPSLPKGEKVTVVAIKKSNGNTYLAMEERYISKEKVENLKFNSVTLAELKNELKKLNDI